MKQSIVTLDLGVLVPKIRIAIAEKAGIARLHPLAGTMEFLDSRSMVQVIILKALANWSKCCYKNL